MMRGRAQRQAAGGRRRMAVGLGLSLAALIAVPLAGPSEGAAAAAAAAAPGAPGAMSYFDLARKD